MFAITVFTGPNGKVNWRIPGDVSQRWIVLRAVQLGAIEPVPANHPVRCLSHHTWSGQPAHAYRWSASGRTHTALPWVYGYGKPGVRWHVSWGPVSPHPGNVLRVEAGTGGGTPSGKGPHQSPSTIPGTAQLIIPGC